MLILYISTLTFAQDNSAFFIKIEEAVKEKEPEWKLVHKLVSTSKKYVSSQWKSGKSSVSALTSVHASAEETIRIYRGLPFDFEVVGLNMTVLEARVPNLGDEHYVWKDSDNEQIYGVNFRKGNVVVHVSAPSIEIAKRFALHIAAEIPAS
jgi:hypothetical protein